MKLKKITQNDPVERLAVSIKQSTMSNLEAYRSYYHATYAETIEKSQLVEEILRDFMASDKNFQRFLTEPAADENKVASTSSASTPAASTSVANTETTTRNNGSLFPSNYGDDE